MKKIVLIIALAFVMLMAISPRVNAQSSAYRFGYKTIIIDSSKKPVADGAYNFRFMLYNQASGGTLLWSEERSLPLRLGNLDVALGSVNPIPRNIFSNTALFLQVCFDANGASGDGSGACGGRYEESFSPRKEMAASFFAGQSSSLVPIVISDSETAYTIESLGGNGNIAQFNSNGENRATISTNGDTSISNGTNTFLISPTNQSINLTPQSNIFFGTSSLRGSTNATTSGAGVVGVFTGGLNNITGTTLQQVVSNIDPLLMWDNISGNAIFTGGNVGIGTTTPSTLLDVNGVGTFTNGVVVGNNTGTTSGSIRFTGGNFQGYNGTTWINFGGGGGSPGGLNGQIQFNNGGIFDGSSNLFWDNTLNRLGIGTSSPSRTLSVNGAVNLATTTAPGGPVAGDMYSNGSNLFYYNGSAWINMTTGATTDGGLGVTYVTNTSNSFAIGGTTSTSPYTFDPAVGGIAALRRSTNIGDSTGFTPTSNLFRVNASGTNSVVGGDFNTSVFNLNYTPSLSGGTEVIQGMDNNLVLNAGDLSELFRVRGSRTSVTSSAAVARLTGNSVAVTSNGEVSEIINGYYGEVFVNDSYNDVYSGSFNITNTSSTFLGSGRILGVTSFVNNQAGGDAFILESLRGQAHNLNGANVQSNMTSLFVESLNFLGGTIGDTLLGSLFNVSNSGLVTNDIVGNSVSTSNADGNAINLYGIRSSSRNGDLGTATLAGDLLGMNLFSGNWVDGTISGRFVGAEGLNINDGIVSDIFVGSNSIVENQDDGIVGTNVVSIVGSVLNNGSINNDMYGLSLNTTNSTTGTVVGRIIGIDNVVLNSGSASDVFGIVSSANGNIARINSTGSVGFFDAPSVNGGSFNILRNNLDYTTIANAGSEVVQGSLFDILVNAGDSTNISALRGGLINITNNSTGTIDTIRGQEINFTSNGVFNAFNGYRTAGTINNTYDFTNSFASTLTNNSPNYVGLGQVRGFLSLLTNSSGAVANNVRGATTDILNSGDIDNFVEGFGSFITNDGNIFSGSSFNGNFKGFFTNNGTIDSANTSIYQGNIINTGNINGLDTNIFTGRYTNTGGVERLRGTWNELINNGGTATEVTSGLFYSSNINGGGTDFLRGLATDVRNGEIGASNVFGNMYGIENGPNNLADGVVGGSYAGIRNWVRNAGQVSDSYYGIQQEMFNYAGGVVSDLRGTYTSITNSGDVTSTFIGTYQEIINNATVPSLYGMGLQVSTFNNVDTSVFGIDSINTIQGDVGADVFGISNGIEIASANIVSGNVYGLNTTLDNTGTIEEEALGLRSLVSNSGTVNGSSFSGGWFRAVNNIDGSLGTSAYGINVSAQNIGSTSSDFIGGYVSATNSNVNLPGLYGLQVRGINAPGPGSSSIANNLVVLDILGQNIETIGGDYIGINNVLQNFGGTVLGSIIGMRSAANGNEIFLNTSNNALEANGTSLFRGNVRVDIEDGVTPADVVITNGALCVSDGTACPAMASGGVYARLAYSTFDVAENILATTDIEAGDIVAIMEGQTEVVRKATNGEMGTIGAISTDPGIVGGYTLAARDGFVPRPIALVGRIPIKVTTENGTINVGDPITASSIPGVGMKATSTTKIVGYALESYSSAGVGKIVVFIQPHYLNLNNGGGSGSVTNVTNITQTVENSQIESIVNTIMQTRFNRGVRDILLGNTEVTIVDPNINADSAVMITPIGSTGNRVLFVDEQVDGSVKVKIDAPADIGIRFRYLIAN